MKVKIQMDGEQLAEVNSFKHLGALVNLEDIVQRA